MPLIRIVSDSDLSDEYIAQVKKFGALIGYEPSHILVEISKDLRQPDVIFVVVMANKKDVVHLRFKEFCSKIGLCLRKSNNKSVEVVRPDASGIEQVRWCPTENGTRIYGE